MIESSFYVQVVSTIDVKIEDKCIKGFLTCGKPLSPCPKIRWTSLAIHLTIW